MMFAFEDV